MALTYGFYNSVDHDRVYTATQMSQIFDGLLTDGVFENFGTNLNVIPGSGLQVLVGIGKARFNDTWTLNDTQMVLPIDPPDLLMDRIDMVILEVNHMNEVRANSIKVIKGTPATDPVAPVLVNDDFIHQYPLAYIFVKVGTINFLPENITKTVGTVSCPFVGLVNRASGPDIDAGLSISKFVTPKGLFDSALIPFASPADAGNILVADGEQWVAKPQDGWIPDISTWTSQVAPVGVAFTNDPANGMNITLNMTNTAGLNKGDLIIVQSTIGGVLSKEIALILTVNLNVSIVVLFLLYNHSTTDRLVTKLEHTKTVTVTGNKTSKIMAGDRIRLTQNGIVKYFIVTNVGSYADGLTPIDLFTGPANQLELNYFDNYLTGDPITNVSISHRKYPFGFPTDPARMQYSLIYYGGAFAQASPVLGVWYSILALGILLPKGLFNLKYKVNVRLNYGATAGAVTLTTISPTVGSELLPQFTWAMANVSTAVNLNASAYGEGVIKNDESKLYYLQECVRNYNSQSLSLQTDTPFRSLLQFGPADL